MHAGILQTAEKRAYYHKMGLRIEKVVWIQWIQFSSKLMPCVSKRENLNKMRNVQRIILFKIQSKYSEFNDHSADNGSYPKLKVTMLAIQH